MPNKQEKKEAARKALDALRASAAADPLRHLEKVAEHLVDPSSGPIVMPQRVPGRLGCATFPLVKEFAFSDPGPEGTEFSILVEPSFDQPLRISRKTIVGPSATPLLGEASTRGNALTCNGLQPCAIVGQPDTLPDASGVLRTKMSLPLDIAVVGNWSFSASVPSKCPKVAIRLSTQFGGVWTTAGVVNLGGGGLTSAAVTGSFGAIGSRPYSVEVIPANSSDSETRVSCQYELTPTTTSSWSCSPAYNEHVMDVFAPDWANVLNASKTAKIVACDCLVTYEGSALENAGSIAVANIDDDLVAAEDGSLYEALASLPFDKYRGRLASVGQAEGGGHWHFIPTSQEQLEPAIPNGDVPVGAFGISGLQAGQVVRIECHFTVNFYSLDPGYKMIIPPPAAGMSLLLWQLRSEIPLCSSNDNHTLKRLKVLARKGAQTAKKAGAVATSPEVVKVLGMLAPLLL